MADFTRPLNFIRSTLSQGGKYYNKIPSRIAVNMAKNVAWAPKVGVGGAVVGGVGGAMAGGRDHRMSGFAAGAGLGSMAGVRRWNTAPAIRGLLG